MNYRNLCLSAAAAAFLSGISSAAPAVYNAGDLLVGFRATDEPGSNSSYVVNLGSVATLRDATGPIVLSLGNLKADLDLVFGPTWHERTDLFWGIGGSPTNIEGTTINGDPGVTLYGSQVQTSPGIPGSGWTIQGSSNRISYSTIIQGAQSAFGTYQQTANSTRAVLQTNSSDLFDWRSYMASGGDPDKTTGNKDFAAFGDIEAAPAKSLGLYRLANASTSTYEGYFTISAAGVITFTPEGATASLTYANWAATNAPGQTADGDYDADGLANGVEFFMGTKGNEFTPSPVLMAGGTITWPRAEGRTVASFAVQISTDLGMGDPWHAVTATVTSTSVSYTLPKDMPKVFVRLVVNP